MPAGVEPQAEAPSAYALLYAKGQFQPLLFIGFLGGVSFCGFGVSLVWYVVGLGICLLVGCGCGRGGHIPWGGSAKKAQHSGVGHTDAGQSKLSLGGTITGRDEKN